MPSVMWLIRGFIQKTYPVNCHAYSPEIFIHLPFQDIGPCCIQHVAVSVIDFGEECCLIKSGGVLKRDEFHGFACFGADGLAGNPPAYTGSRFSHMPV